MHGLERASLAELCAALGEPAFRARQIWRWLYVQRAGRWEEMRNVPAALREMLAGRYRLQPLRVVGRIGGTTEEAARKFLVETFDGQRVEQVLIPAGRRQTVCVSTQVGCRFACAFCASGQRGLVRNLETGEIVAQVLLAAEETRGRLTHVVFMGIGEPFDNCDHVLRAVRILNDPEGMAIGARRITISTCGVAPGIQRLADEGLQVELSVSLHAPDDELRSRLMPVNRLYPLAELLETCAAYTAATNRIVTFEYAMIRNVNDSPAHARRLAERIAPVRGRANLIPLSPVAEFDGLPSSRHAIDAFSDILARKGVQSTVRASRGADCHAACGQLRAQSAGEHEGCSP